MILSYTIKENDNYYNIQDLLKNHFMVSDRLFIRLKRNGKIFINNVLVDGKKIHPNNTLLKTGDTVTFNIDFENESDNIISTNIHLDIIYEDDSLLILNKPSRIATHPSALHPDDTLSNGVKFYYEQIGLKQKIRPVNRLDRNTSGLIVFAKNEYVQHIFTKQMTSHIFIKKYLAIVHGIISPPSGTINLPIARSDSSIINRKVSENGLPSITHYKTLNTYILNNQEISLIECTLETGRTHQIRVHFSHIGHPLLGDSLYGSSSDLIDSQALHSYYLEFIHPITHKKMSFISNDINKVFPFLKDL